MMRTQKKSLLYAAALAVVLILPGAGGYRTTAGAQLEGNQVWGTWVIALDTSIFGLPGGVFPGLATFHRDGTMAAVDGGDLSSLPFTTTDTSQRGVWVQTGHQTVEWTTLFLRKDELTGQLEGWHRVRATLQFTDGDHLVGFATEEVLECNPAGPTPFKLLNCGDPTVDTFQLLTAGLPLKLTRLQAN